MSFDTSMRQAQRSPLRAAIYMVWAHFIWWGVFRFVLLWMAVLKLQKKTAEAQAKQRAAATG